jgi:hypothetical protein
MENKKTETTSRDLLKNVVMTTPIVTNKVYKDQRVTVRRDVLEELNEKVNILTKPVEEPDAYTTICFEDMFDKLDPQNLNLQTKTEELQLRLDPNNTETKTIRETFTFDSEDGFVGLKSLTITANVDDVGTQLTTGLLEIDTSIDNDKLEALLSDDGLVIDLTKTVDINRSADEDLEEPSTFFGTEKIILHVDMVESTNITLNRDNITLDIADEQFIEPAGNQLGFIKVSVTPVLEEYSVTAPMIGTENTTIDIADIESSAIGFNKINLPSREADLIGDNAVAINFKLSSTNNSDLVVNSSLNRILQQVIEPNFIDNYVITNEPSTETFYTYTDDLGDEVTHYFQIGDVITQNISENSSKYWIYSAEGTWTEYSLGDKIFINDPTTIGSFSEISENELISKEASQDKLGFNKVDIKAPGSFKLHIDSIDPVLTQNPAADDLVITFTDTQRSIQELTIPRVITTPFSLSALTLSSLINDPEITSVSYTPKTDLDSDSRVNADRTFYSGISIELPKDANVFAPDKNTITTIETLTNYAKLDDTANFTFEVDDINLVQAKVFNMQEASNILNLANESTIKSFFIDGTKDLNLKLAIDSEIAQNITVYQIDADYISINKEYNIYSDANKLFSFKYPGIQYVNTSQSVLEGENISTSRTTEVKNPGTYIVSFKPNFVVETNTTTTTDENGDMTQTVSYTANGLTVSIFADNDDYHTLTPEETCNLITDVKAIGQRAKANYFAVKIAPDITYERHEVSVNNDNEQALYVVQSSDDEGSENPSGITVKFDTVVQNNQQIRRLTSMKIYNEDGITYNEYNLVKEDTTINQLGAYMINQTGSIYNNSHIDIIDDNYIDFIYRGTPYHYCYTKTIEDGTEVLTCYGDPAINFRVEFSELGGKLIVKENGETVECNLIKNDYIGTYTASHNTFSDAKFKLTFAANYLYFAPINCTFINKND